MVSMSCGCDDGGWWEGIKKTRYGWVSYNLISVTIINNLKNKNKL